MPRVKIDAQGVIAAGRSTSTSAPGIDARDDWLDTFPKGAEVTRNASASRCPACRPTTHRKAPATTMNHPICLLLCLLLLAPGAGAEMYRYVDENGVTVYSQTPPPHGDAQVLEPQTGPPSATRDAARAALQGRLEAAQDRRDDETMTAEEQAETAAEAAARRAGCDAARQNLKTLQRAGQHLTRDEEGKLRYINAKERQRRLQEAREQIDERCK